MNIVYLLLIIYYKFKNRRVDTLKKVKNIIKFLNIYVK